MSSDGRYMYHPSSGMEQYDYQPYPQSSYDSAQFPTNSARTTRTNGAHPHSPPPAQPPAQYGSPTAPYPTPYGPAPYPAPPPGPPSWTNQPAWAGYGPYAPGSVQAQSPYPSSLSRPDNASSAAPHSRPQASPADPPRSAGIAAGSPPSPSQPMLRAQSPLQHPGSGSVPPMDFTKLRDSCESILEYAKSFSMHTEPPPRETLERMVESASFGYRMLDLASLQAISPNVRASEERSGTGPPPDAGDKKTAKLPEAPAQDGQRCLGCQATSTPEWRRGPMGPRTLCNACGLVYAKMIKKRGRERTGASSAANHTGDDSGSEGSDDEGSYVSHDRRSEANVRR
ncbi:hypothetical protein PUNSTDRAFT_112925 [Punctularia strigosozonata HHB-11173 SS5]|uniref:uncharacterized protein n=1 Tax=Punctularia strigosozonata (strain HHB-11173) TaxID=741275 RepID=UPI00044169BD|nr:uncharacterized protein PUNSTDRAFT_112925 [Punctularia strigosozonata HHB-11173 SS5]EIN09454.1 hypothetical protein PUNSTDRAFT_112925 [Punctularia strigosozonata HHB-11173 SS5]